MNAEYDQARRDLAVGFDRPAPLPRQVLGTRCLHCGVRPGAHCVMRGTDVRLRHTQAHPARWKAAGFEEPTPRVPVGALSREQAVPGTPGRVDGSVAATGRQAVA